MLKFANLHILCFYSCKYLNIKYYISLTNSYVYTVKTE